VKGENANHDVGGTFERDYPRDMGDRNESSGEGITYKLVEIGKGVRFAEELNMNALVVNNFVSSDVPKRGKDELGCDCLSEGRGGKRRIISEDGRGEGLRRGGEEINEGVKPDIPAEGGMGAAHA
jgi:hypothetical protein